jgi:hypothetical protein
VTISIRRAAILNKVSSRDFATAPDDTRRGATVGTGIEFGFAPNWSVAAEYGHPFMQDRLYRFTDTCSAAVTSRIGPVMSSAGRRLAERCRNSA